MEKLQRDMIIYVVVGIICLFICAKSESYMKLYNFEQSADGWENEGSETNWIRESGQHVDHTTNSVNGYYMTLQSFNKNISGKLINNNLPLSTTVCLVLWYYMTGRSSVRFSVDTRNSSTSERRFSGHYTSYVNTWIGKQIDFQTDKEEKTAIILYAVIGAYTSIAVDDIVLQNGTCPDNSPTVLSTTVSTGSSSTSKPTTVSPTVTASVGIIAGVIFGIGVPVTVAVVVACVLRRKPVSNEKKNKKAGDLNLGFTEDRRIPPQVNFQGHDTPSYDGLQSQYNGHKYCEFEEDVHNKIASYNYDYITIYDDDQNVQAEMSTIPTGNNTTSKDYLDPV